MIGLILYTTENFKDYISVYVCIVALCSAAVFTLLLPKTFDYFNNRNYRNYKEMLDLRKSIIDNGRMVDSSVNEMIDNYENVFITGREENLRKQRGKYSSWKSVGQILIIIIISILAIVGLPLALYKLWLMSTIF